MEKGRWKREKDYNNSNTFYAFHLAFYKIFTREKETSTNPAHFPPSLLHFTLTLEF
jgi:hypothetical protein